MDDVLTQDTEVLYVHTSLVALSDPADEQRSKSTPVLLLRGNDIVLVHMWHVTSDRRCWTSKCDRLAMGRHYVAQDPVRLRPSRLKSALSNEAI